MRKVAGIIPYIITDDQIKMLFMVSSDPSFGGDKPMVSKGGVDPGEDSLTGALREGNEELGLNSRNIIGAPILVDTVLINGFDSTYPMTIYAVEVSDPYDFDQPHYETEYTTWLTLEEYRAQGRRSHLVFVEKLASKLRARMES